MFTIDKILLEQQQQQQQRKRKENVYVIIPTQSVLWKAEHI